MVVITEAASVAVVCGLASAADSGRTTPGITVRSGAVDITVGLALGSADGVTLDGALDLVAGVILDGVLVVTGSTDTAWDMGLLDTDWDMAAGTESVMETMAITPAVPTRQAIRCTREAMATLHMLRQAITVQTVRTIQGTGRPH